MSFEEWEKQFMRRIQAQGSQLGRIFNEFISESSPILTRYKAVEKGGVWARNKAIEKQLERKLQGLQAKLQSFILKETDEAWEMAAQKTDELVSGFIEGLPLSATVRQGLFSRNLDALQAFQKRRVGNMNLSQRVWNICEQTKTNIEYYLQSGLAEGRGAAKMSQDVRQLLNNPDKRFRRIRDPETGKLKLSKPMKGYHPGQGVYRSAYKNAMRMTRTETNMAYRLSDHHRWKKIEFVKGFEVQLSPSHPTTDICDEMVGEYPKTFVFGGWHANCYKAGTEVFTKDGWKEFKDVKDTDMIYTLNPGTKELELSPVSARMAYHYQGNLIRFYNRSLDLQVTPDHRMIYLAKSDGRVMDDKTAGNYSKNNGGMYRSCEWKGNSAREITIGNHAIDMMLYAAFMGYYLADGSYTRKYAMTLAQKQGHDVLNRRRIEHYLKRMPFDVKVHDYGFWFTDRSFWEHVQPLGRSVEKYIPDTIKEASPDIIRIFLKAFGSCDGSVRKGRSFIGNRGNEFIPQEPDRIYFTSSRRLADDIGELILKLGKRPSFHTKDMRGKHQFPNGEYNINHVMWIIRECRSKTTTVFDKEEIPYNGMVYDLEVAKNHTLYVRYNGKCVWSSNCYCRAVPILATRDQFVGYLETGKAPVPVKSIPGKAQAYVKKKTKQFRGWKNSPYWLDENFTLKDGKYVPRKSLKTIKTSQ